MSTSMRAKVTLSSVESNQDSEGKVYSELLTFYPVAKSSYTDSEYDEDNTYARMSPSGQFRLTVANPALIGKFKQGEKYYVDFMPVD